MTHWRAPRDESSRYVVNPWRLAFGVTLALAVAIFAAADFVGRICR